MIKSARCLLRLLKSFEFPSVNELKIRKHWFELRLSLIWDILASHEIDLKWIELLSQKGVQDTVVSLNGNVQIINLNCFQFVKFPSEFFVFLSFEQEARHIKSV